MNKKKICVVVNSRANYARIKSVLLEIKKNKKAELQLIVGASALIDKFGDLREIIKKDGLKIKSTLFYMIEGENLSTMAKSTGLAIIELSTIFGNIKPDIVLTVADRFETMSTAIAASYMNIPLVHTQGGEITGSIDESVRHAITKLSHVHFPSTKLAFKNVIKLGENKKNVFLTGCPSIDLAKSILDKPKLKNIKEGTGYNVDLKKPYLVVMQHPVTTEFSKIKKQIQETLRAVAKLNIQTIWFWPNIDAGSDSISKMLRTYREKNKIPKVRFCKNFSPELFLNLINNCACLIGNSSVAIREGSFLGIPSVNIGNRQSGREHGKNIIHAKYISSSIIKGVKAQIKHGKYKKEKIFGNGNSAKIISKLLMKVKPNIQKKLII